MRQKRSWQELPEGRASQLWAANSVWSPGVSGVWEPVEFGRHLEAVIEGLQQENLRLTQRAWGKKEKAGSNVASLVNMAPVAAKPGLGVGV